MEHSLEEGRQEAATTADPSSVFLVKTLLYPVVSCVSLISALLVAGYPLKGPYFLVMVLGFIGAGDMMNSAGWGQTQPRFPPLRFLFDIWFRWIPIAGFIWAVVYSAGLLPHTIDPRVLLFWTVATPFLFWVSRSIAAEFLRSVSARRIAQRKVVIVGMTDIGIRLANKLREDPLLGMTVLGFFDARAPERLDKREKLLGEMNQIAQFVGDRDVAVVYITLPLARHPRILELLDHLRDSTTSIYFVPDMFMFDLIQARFDLVRGIPVIAVCESPFFGMRGMVKRTCDLVIAGTVLLFIWPVLLAVAIGVRLSSPGPVLFKQRRYGLDGKEIVVYKFRSMTVVEDGATQYTQVTRNDTRVPPFGAFIRKTSLDELPQLFNVLEGTMSLVGPRPHAVAVNEQYRRLISGYMVRHKVKPGITGWAQVNGYRGGDDLPSMQMRIQYDLEYLRHWSLGLDLSIILKTALVVLADKKAY